MSLLQFILINVNLLVLFGLFLVFSRGRRNLHFNRFYLLLMPIVAIALPFLSFTGSASQSSWATELPTITVLSNRSFVGSESINIETIIYGLGALLFLAILSYQIFMLFKPKKATFNKTFNGAAIYLLNNNEATHSFFKRIYLSPNNLENEEIILIHENAHCKGYHSIDLIVMAIYKSIFWFNPFIYGWHKMVKENHEFIADQKVMAHNISASNYGEILVEMTFDAKAPVLTNTFNTKSMLRKRIENLNLKNQYPMKNLIIIPVVAALALFSMSLTLDNATSAAPLPTKTLGEDLDVKPTFVGGQDALIKFMISEITYPKSLANEGAEGKVFVEFSVKANGQIADVKIIKACEFEAMNAEAVRVIKKMPNWNPGKKDGKSVKAKMTLPIAFTMSK